MAKSKRLVVKPEIPVSHKAQDVEVRSAALNQELRRTEEVLEASRTRYFDLYDLAPVGYFILSELGLILEANLTAVTLLGVTRDALLNRPLIDFILPEDKDIYDTHRQQLFETGAPQACELRIRRQDHPPLWARVEATAARVADGSRVFRTVMSDITERKRAEEALLADKDRFRTLFLKSPLGMGPADSEYRFLDVNEALCQMLGYSRDELLGLTVLDITFPDDRPQYQSFWKDVISGVSRGLQTEKRYVRKDGTILRAKVTTAAVTSPDSAFLYGLGIFEDITALKLAEEALRESEEKYRTLVENAAEAIVIAQDGRLKFVNRMATEISGYSEQELRSSPFLEFIHPDDRDMVGERYLKSLKNDVSPLKYACRLMNKDGSVKWVEINAVLVTWEGKPATLNFLSDITERKRAEEALRKSESNLRALAVELSRAEEHERQRLALFLHDEIGQSLALLRMRLGSLAGATRSKSGRRDIQLISDLMEKVIDQTHTLTFELSPPVLHQLGLEAAIEWAGEKISRDHGIDFIFNDDGRMKPLDFDLKALLFRCVRELMMNIVKHAKARKMTVSLKRTDDHFCAVVEDDGIGFETSLLETPLEKVGFGLFSIREGLAAAGGTFEIQSGPGRGTRAAVAVHLKEIISSN